MHLLVLLYFLNSVLNAESFDPSSHKNWNLLHNKKCGQRLDDRIVGGSPVTMGAYAWMARIAYKGLFNPGKFIFKCGGTLANEKTVITAAHCLEMKRSVFPTVAFVRLGEHDSRTKVDCWKSTCINAAQDIEPASIILHKDYLKNSNENDIGIIRLKKAVTYTFYVQPICFLHGRLITKDFIGEKAVVAGWGIKNPTTLKSSPILLAVELPIVDNSICEKAYQPVTQINEKVHMCVGGDLGKDSCGGDSGGPLMKLEDFDGFPKYYLLGVVSFGPRHCGTENWPGIYTRVSQYMEWILDNLVENTVKYHIIL